MRGKNTNKQIIIIRKECEKNRSTIVQQQKNVSKESYKVYFFFPKSSISFRLIIFRVKNFFF